MKVLGITGGVGSGKSEVLRYLEEKYGAVVCQADQVAKNLQRRGGRCYQQITEHFGKGILDEKGRIDRAKLAEIVFHDAKELEVLNSIVHPAVRKRILELKKAEEKKGTKLFVLEAALLLEDHYEPLCDEVWCVFANDDVRKRRLKLSRGYTEDKAEAIFRSQMTREEFLEHCDRAIDNSESFEETCAQLDAMLKKWDGEER